MGGDMSQVCTNSIAKADKSASILTDGLINGSAKAWVNFNGTNAVIRSGFNVSGVVRTGLGHYNITFTNPMPDTNYAIVGNCMAYEGIRTVVLAPITWNTSFCRVCAVLNSDANVFDPDYVSVVIFR